MKLNEFRSIWNKAIEENPPLCDGASKKLVEIFTNVFDIECIEYLQGENTAFFLVDMSSLGYSRLDLNILAVVSPSTDEKKAFEDLRFEQIIREEASAEGLIFKIIIAENPELLSDLPKRDNTIYLFKEDLERLLSSLTPQVAIFDIIHRYVPLARANPFNTKREARGAMFVGREHELAKLTSSDNFRKNFAVTGARFIGKTSLLIKAHHYLKHRPFTIKRSFFINANSIQGLIDLSHRMAWAIDPRRDTRISFSSVHLLRLFREASKKGREPLLLFFDEADTMLAIDSNTGWNILKVLQEAIQESYIRIVFAGFNNVDDVLSHPMCPLSFPRYFEHIELKPLTKKELEQLINNPFNESKIRIDSHIDVINKIWELSEGYPFIIQYIGEKLFDLSIKRNPPSITVGDIESHIIGNYDFDKFLKMYFLYNTMRGNEPFLPARIAAYLYLHKSEGEPWTDGDFMVKIDSAGYKKLASPEKVSLALSMLYNMSLLKYTKYGYVLGLKILIDVIKRCYPDKESLLQLMGDNS